MVFLDKMMTHQFKLAHDDDESQVYYINEAVDIAVGFY